MSLVPPSVSVPASVVAAAGRDPSTAVDVLEVPLRVGTGAATSGLTRLTLRVRNPKSTREEIRLIRKTFRPLRSGRHRHGTEDQRHWTYWRREPLAYASDLLPRGPGLRAPRCYGLHDASVYLEDVGDLPADADAAAHLLGAWQARAGVPAVPWLSGHQLAQRIEVSHLDWSAVHADPRAEALWADRTDLLSRLARVPQVLSHGDFHQGNLRLRGADTVVLDWGTLGLAPAGSDLAHLALSTQEDLQDEYLAGLDGTYPEDLVELAYRVTLVLAGASRVHWMLSGGIDVPDGYVDFLWASRPGG